MRGNAAAGVMGIGFLAGVLVVAVQCYWYLRSGVWFPLDLMTFGCEYVSWGWACSPSSWIGLHSILAACNAGFGAIVAAVAVGILIASS